MEVDDTVPHAEPPLQIVHPWQSTTPKKLPTVESDAEDEAIEVIYSSITSQSNSQTPITTDQLPGTPQVNHFYKSLVKDSKLQRMATIRRWSIKPFRHTMDALLENTSIEKMQQVQLDRSNVKTMCKKHQMLKNTTVLTVHEKLPSMTVWYEVPPDHKHAKNLILGNGMYTGSIYKTKLDGPGTWIAYDGSIYEGVFQNDQKHGHGRLIDWNGNVWVSVWANDVQIGYAEYKGADGSEYKGNMVDFKMHGEGEFSTEQYEYSGSFEEGKKHGHGKVAYVDGSSYQGMFVNNMRQGKGIFVWANGQKYKGEWDCNHLHGNGRLYSNTGEIYIGTFACGKRHGSGVEQDLDKNFHMGSWSFGKRDGQFHVERLGDLGVNQIVRIQTWKEGELVQDEEVQLIQDEEFQHSRSTTDRTPNSNQTAAQMSKTLKKKQNPKPKKDKRNPKPPIDKRPPKSPKNQRHPKSPKNQRPPKSPINERNPEPAKNQRPPKFTTNKRNPEPPKNKRPSKSPRNHQYRSRQ